jgi:glycine cleavage system transcriptional repressor
MRSNVVVTVTGADRVGIVEEVTKVLLDLGGNVETSRMARLGGEFAMLMLVSLSPDQAAGLETALRQLAERGYKVATSVTQQTYEESHPGWIGYRIEVQGADHEGIVHEIAAGLARRGISIESAETSTASAPVSGTPLFSMTAEVMVPPGLDEATWLSALDDAARQSNVDISVVGA